jgi:hypothetical protein
MLQANGAACSPGKGKQTGKGKETFFSQCVGFALMICLQFAVCCSIPL